MGEYVPEALRATTLYEDVKMRAEKEEMRLPRDLWDKIQVGALALLAGGLVIAMIFLIAITTKES